jgi:hypothetical protein
MRSARIFPFVGILSAVRLRFRLVCGGATRSVGESRAAIAATKRNISPAGNLKVNADGSLSSFTLASAAERSNYSFDAALKIGAFDLIGEYLSEHVDGRLVNGFAPIANFQRTAGMCKGAITSSRKNYRPS